MFNSEDTIVALATPSGSGAIAVIRLSGKQSIDIVNKVFFGKDLSKQDSHTIHFGTIRYNDEIIDEVLVSLFIAPKSYTKENSVEISCHASPFIIQQLLNIFVSLGARMANPGEFTMRAFLNGQLDLSQAEAVADLIASKSKASHSLALKQLRGGYSHDMTNLRQQLIDFTALIELELDFSEEDVEFANREQLKDLINNIRLHIKKLISSFSLGNAIKNGIPVVIAGKPNAGKSTLLNALLNEDRAIVSEIAGTTRDTIEDVVNIKGIDFRFIDTAGIRETADKIEAIGVEKAYQKIKQSALVIYLFDPEEISVNDLKNILKELSEHTDYNNIIPVANKIDKDSYDNLKQQFNDIDNIIWISAKDRINLDTFVDVLTQKSNINNLNSEDVLVSNVRHLEALQQTDSSLAKTLELIENVTSTELLSFELKQALYYFGTITGQVSTDDLLDSIFTKFCIGK